MYTINDRANKELNKAKKALSAALLILEQMPEYNDRKSIYHNTTVKQVNTIITTLEMIRDL